MQVRAIIEAAIDCQKRKIKVIPEIMHPLTLDKKELQILDQATRRIADAIISRSKVKLHYLVGTMIELPRAALDVYKRQRFMLSEKRGFAYDEINAAFAAGADDLVDACLLYTSRCV